MIVMIMVTNSDNIFVMIKPVARCKLEPILLFNDSDDGLAGAGEVGG